MAVLGLDLEGMIVMYNKMGASLFGEPCLGKTGLCTFSPEINTFINAVIQKGFMAEKIMQSERIMRVKGMIMQQDDGQEGIILVFDEDTYSRNQEVQ